MIQETRTHPTFKVPEIRDGHCIVTIQDSLADVDIDPAMVTGGRVEARLAEAGYPPENLTRACRCSVAPPAPARVVTAGAGD